ncbi:MAG TPA: hypothetical protein VFB62_23185 [Polyangiaceae bacterium]|nr:hypothetical protein [Polyangiaceae bacterium]
MKTDAWTVVLGLFGLGNLANAAWMLLAPVHWYLNLPAGVPDFGPLNEHFVRDIGCIYLLMGAALTAAALAPRWRVMAVGAVTLFHLLHAVVHVIDTLRGLVGSEHWVIDVPGVYLPAAILTVLTWLLARKR